MARDAPRFWRSCGLGALALLPFAALFGGLAALRRQAYRWHVLRSERLPVPVVVVGNVAVGGSGKTPVVEWLVGELRRAGFRPGVVSRGYGGNVAGEAILPPQPETSVYGDEPVLLARLTGCPVAVGADRPAAARALLAAHPECDVIVADDGLQHYRLARDIEIAVVDEATLGNRFLLPAGPLRETVARLRTVDLVIAHGGLSAALREALGGRQVFDMALAGDEFVALDGSGRRCRAADFGAGPVHAIAGIGRPERFFAQMRNLGLNVIPHPFPDHHPFAYEDLLLGDAAPKIMTSKDAVKCAPFAPAETWEFPVRAKIAAGAADFIVEKLRHGRETA